MTSATAAIRDVARRLDPVRRDLRVVAEPRVSLGAVSAVVVTLLFGTLFVLAVLQALLVQGQLRLDQADAEISEREAVLRELEVEVNRLEAPDRVLSNAVDAGMVRPGHVVFVDEVRPIPFDPIRDQEPTEAAELARLLVSTSEVEQE